MMETDNFDLYAQPITRYVGEMPEAALSRRAEKLVESPWVAALTQLTRFLRLIYRRLLQYLCYALAASVAYQNNDITLQSLGLIALGLILRHTAIMERESITRKRVMVEQIIQANDPRRINDIFEHQFIP